MTSMSPSTWVETEPLRFSTCRAGTGPLTWAQKGMWNNIQAIAPHDQHLNLALTVPVPDPLPVDRALAALRTLVARHDALRTTFPVDDRGQPFQSVAGAGAIPVVSANTPDSAGGSFGMQSSLAAERFELTTDPPLRIGLGIEGGLVRNVVLCLSHLVVDAWAVQLVLQELKALLASPNGVSELAAVTRQPIEQARFETDVLAPRFGRRVSRYWSEVLRACPTEDTFTARGEPATPRFWQGVYSSRAAQCAARLLAGRCGVSESSVQLAAVYRALTDYTERSAFPVLLRASNRFVPELKRSVAYLCQNTPVLVRDTGGPFPQLVQVAQRAALRAYLHSQYDPDTMKALSNKICAARSHPADLSTTLNFVQYGLDAGPQPECPSGPELRGLVQDSSFMWRRRYDTERVRLFVTVAGGAHLELIGDTRYFPPDEIRDILRSIETILVDEAASEPTA